MKKESPSPTEVLENRILVTTDELKILCGNCGRSVALKIGNEAKARVSVGRRVFWSVPKITAFLERTAE